MIRPHTIVSHGKRLSPPSTHTQTPRHPDRQTHTHIHTHAAHTRTHTHIQTHTHTDTYTHTNTHTLTHTHIQTNIHTHTLTHAHIQTHTHTLTHTHMQTNKQTNKHTHTDTYTHANKHTHTHSLIVNLYLEFCHCDDLLTEVLKKTFYRTNVFFLNLKIQHTRTFLTLIHRLTARDYFTGFVQKRNNKKKNTCSIKQANYFPIQDQLRVHLIKRPVGGNTTSLWKRRKDKILRRLYSVWSRMVLLMFRYISRLQQEDLLTADHCWHRPLITITHIIGVFNIQGSGLYEALTL
jgi:hypothetical protein